MLTHVFFRDTTDWIGCSDTLRWLLADLNPSRMGWVAGVVWRLRRMMQLLSKFGATCAPVRWAGSEASLVSGAGALEGTRF